jgi:serine/threonine-protein kinase
MPSPSLLRRLKERKLVQWTLAYLAGAWVVFQAVEVMAEPWGILPALQRAVHILLVVGLFITLVFAWYHGEKGRQRVSGPELLMVAALLVVAGVALTLLGSQDEGFSPVALEGDDRPGIAVFPCENWSPDPGDAYFASGIHDEILLRLSKISGLRSIGRESMEWYRDNPMPMRQVAQELGVSFLGECSVLKDVERNQIRLTFQLLDGNTGTQIWADNYDEDLSVRGIFDIHSDVARRVAQAVGAALTPEERVRIRSAPTNSPEAYQYYLRGREAVRRRSSSDIQGAFGFFEAALREDDDFAEAHAGLADAWIHRGWEEADTAYFRRAREAAERAIAMDSLLAEAHTSKAYALLFGEWDWDGPEGSFQTAIRLDPNNPEAHHWYGEYLSAIGRFDAGVRETSLALEMDPLAPAVVCDQGSALEFAGRIQEAVSFYEQCLRLAPTWWAPYASLILTYPLIGREADALRVLEQTIQLFGSSDDLASWESLSEMEDFQAVLLRTLAFLEDRRGSGSLFLRKSYFLAVLHVLAGQPNEAFEHLEAAVNERHPALAKTVMGRPSLGPIRDDPRFRQILRRMGLEG